MSHQKRPLTWELCFSAINLHFWSCNFLPFQMPIRQWSKARRCHFRLTTYNILAQCYADNNRNLYRNMKDPNAILWKNRWPRLQSELKASTSILFWNNAGIKGACVRYLLPPRGPGSTFSRWYHALFDQQSILGVLHSKTTASARWKSHCFQHELVFNDRSARSSHVWWTFRQIGPGRPSHGATTQGYESSSSSRNNAFGVQPVSRRLETSSVSSPTCYDRRCRQTAIAPMLSNSMRWFEFNSR